MKQLAIPLSNQQTVAKWLVITQQNTPGKSLVIAIGHANQAVGYRPEGGDEKAFRDVHFIENEKFKMRKFKRLDIAGLLLGFMLNMLAGSAVGAVTFKASTSAADCKSDVTIDSLGTVKCGGAELLPACAGDIIIDSKGVIRCSVLPTCTLAAAPSSIALGGSSTLTASCTPAATSYTWTGGTCVGKTTTCIVTPTITTPYTVAGTNSAGTSSAASATVTVTGASIPTCTLAQSFQSVPAGQIRLAASCTPEATSWAWSANTGIASTGSSSILIASPTVTTPYSVTGSNAAGAGNLAQLTITGSVTAPPVTATPTCTLTQSFQSVPAGQIRLAASCTPDATSWAWSANTGIASTGSSSILIASPTVTTPYSVTGSNAAGAGNLAPLTINVVNPTPTCTLVASPSSVGAGENSVLTATSCSPAATNGYAWTGGTCAGTSAASCTVTPAATTTYSVAGINANGTGAAASATVNVGTPVCSATASPLVNAANPLYVTTTLTASCDRAVTQYNWTPAAGLVAGTNTAAVTLLKTALGITTYNVNGQNGIPPSPGANAAVSVNVAMPSCTVTASPASINQGGTSTLTASCTPGAASYSWTPDPGLALNPVAPTTQTATVVTSTSTAAGVYNYSVTGTNAVGTGASSANATVTVTLPPADPGCPGGYTYSIVSINWAQGLSFMAPLQTVNHCAVKAFQFTMQNADMVFQTFYADVRKYISLSQTAFEFSPALAASLCATDGGPDATLNSSATAKPGRCQATAGATYYLNVRNAQTYNGPDLCPAGSSCTFHLKW